MCQHCVKHCDLSHFILTLPHSHFTEEESEVQWRQMICPGSNRCCWRNQNPDSGIWLQNRHSWLTAYVLYVINSLFFFQLKTSVKTPQTKANSSATREASAKAAAPAPGKGGLAVAQAKVGSPAKASRTRAKRGAGVEWRGGPSNGPSLDKGPAQVGVTSPELCPGWGFT